LDRQHSGGGNENRIGCSPDQFFPCGEKWSGNETRLDIPARWEGKSRNLPVPFWFMEYLNNFTSRKRNVNVVMFDVCAAESDSKHSPVMLWVQLIIEQFANIPAHQNQNITGRLPDVIFLRREKNHLGTRLHTHIKD